MKIAALCSGGVDSSVALGLLEEQDHDVTAFYLRIWLEDELQHLSECPWKEDLDYIRELCKLTKVKLEVVSMQRDYYQRVVHHAIEEVKQGRTPNPDIWCNTRIKFGLFYDMFGDEFDAIASGHYAQIAKTASGSPCLKQAPDPVKDQTYFLSHLPAEKLKKLRFPIGSYTKAQVRTLAEEMALPNAKRKDSQGICFLGKFKYRDFIEHHLGKRPGKFVEFESGKIVGSHDGFWFYTSGQRKGLGIGGARGSNGSPWYVVAKNPEDNVVFVSQNYYEIPRRKFTISNCNWLMALPAKTLEVKLRHGPNKQICQLTRHNEDNYLVELSSDDQGIAAGQYAVFYFQDLCVGSGIINEEVLL